MRYLSRALFAGALVAAFLAVGPVAVAQAAETASSDVLIIRDDVVIDDDLYATGNRILIEGTVEGDLIAFAAEEIEISGTVEGSVYALAPTVVHSGSIGGSLRASAGDVRIEGNVDHDVVAAVVSLVLESDSTVGGDVLVWSITARLEGSIGEDLEATVGTMSLEGEIAGDANVTLRSLEVTGPLVVGGDFSYRSEAEADGLDQVEAGGVVVHETPLPPNIRVRAVGLLGRILIALLLTATSVLVAWGWPKRADRADEKARTKPFRAWGMGALAVFSPIVLAGAAGVLVALAPGAALPLLAVLGPLVLALAGLILALSLVAGVPAVLRLGRLLPGDFGIAGSVLAGSALASLVWLLPLVGWLVPLTVLPLGLGAWVLSLRGGGDQQGEV